jgi:hypothetical protein
MSRLTFHLNLIFPRWRAMQRLAQAALPVFIDRASADVQPFGLLLEKTRNGIVVRCNLNQIRQHRHLAATFAIRPAVVVKLFAATGDGVRFCAADFSDGYFCSAGVVGFSSPDRAAILIPDPSFYNGRGYAKIRSLATTVESPWQGRSDTVLWRGSTTGRGIVAAAEMSPTNAALIQRTRVCLLLCNIDGIDVKLSSVVQGGDQSVTIGRLRDAGLLGTAINQAAWLKYKFAIDIDGNTNAWSNLFNRLLLGCCVIKIASPTGYRQWYYDDLIPWQHYVPVKADMSDLIEKIDWCRSNPDQCEEIAIAGQQLAMKMTFESEVARGVETLNERLS